MKLEELTVGSFSELLASEAPAPGGGSTAALGGALGAALTAMICRLTVGKEVFAEHRESLLQIQQQADFLRIQLLQLMEQDTQAFLRVSEAFALPKNTPEEKSVRSAAIQEGLKGCTETPLELMRLADRILQLAASLIGRFNQNAASDLGVAALCLKAAIQGAWLNVLINVGSLKDKQLAEQFRREGEALLHRALPAADQLYRLVEELIR